MESYFGSQTTLRPPWNPNLVYLTERVLGREAQTLPPVSTTTSQPSKGAVDLAIILQAEHETYTKYKKVWMDALNWYNGDDMILTYIHRHPREQLEHYLRRQQRGYYWNYTESILGLISSFIYSKTITRSLSDKSPETAMVYSEELEEFWKNVDRLGTTADDFFQLVELYVLVFGLSYVMVDKPVLPFEGESQALVYSMEMSEQQRRDLGLSPYLYLIPTLNLTNWRLRVDGSFEWARWYSDVDVPSSPFNSPLDYKIRRFTTWTTTEWFVHDVIYPRRGKPYGSLIDQGINSLGEVPVVRFVAKKELSEQNFGKSLGYTIGKINVAILNYLSLLDEDLYGKCLNLLAVQVDDIPTTENTNAPAQPPVTIGANNVLTYSSLNQPPFYLAPSSDPGHLLMTHVAACKDQMYRLSLFGGISEPKAPYSEKSGAAYCLAEGTLIDVPRDLSLHPYGVPIEQLVGASPFYIYCRLHGAPALCLAKRAWKSGTHVPVYRVNFWWWGGKGFHEGAIEATESHKFMLRDGSYRAVRDLEKGDALMPFSRSTRGKYVVVQGPGGFHREYEHRFITRQLLKEEFDETLSIHHINGNRFDNRIANLEMMSKSTHASHHMQDEAFVERVRLGGEKRREAHNGRWVELSEKAILAALDSSDWRPTYAAKTLGVCFITLKRKMLRLGISTPNNHRVSSIEFAGYKDVFDIEVPQAHNFVANGIVVHNSYEFNETNRMLSEKARSMELGEMQVCKMWAKWMGLYEQGIGFVIDYPETFEVEELAKELQDIMSAQNIVTSSQTFNQEMQKRVVRRMIDHDFVETIKTINAEIDANTPDPVDSDKESDEDGVSEKSEEMDEEIEESEDTEESE